MVGGYGGSSGGGGCGDRMIVGRGQTMDVRGMQLNMVLLKLLLELGIIVVCLRLLLRL